MGTRAESVSFRGIFNQTLTYTGTLDLASATNGNGQTVTLTVPGVALGDIVYGVSLTVDISGWLAFGVVSAADTVKVRFQNVSGGTLDPASGTLKVLVGKPNRTTFQ